MHQTPPGISLKGHSSWPSAGCPPPCWQRWRVLPLPVDEAFWLQLQEATCSELSSWRTISTTQIYAGKRARWDASNPGDCWSLSTVTSRSGYRANQLEAKQYQTQRSPTRTASLTEAIKVGGTDQDHHHRKTEHVQGRRALRCWCRGKYRGRACRLLLNAAQRTALSEKRESRGLHRASKSAQKHLLSAANARLSKAAL